ncbi:MAG: stalk domain-containing protein [Eubacteriales bacterium]
MRAYKRIFVALLVLCLMATTAFATSIPTPTGLSMDWAGDVNGFPGLVWDDTESVEWEVFYYNCTDLTNNDYFLAVSYSASSFFELDVTIDRYETFQSGELTFHESGIGISYGYYDENNDYEIVEGDMATIDCDTNYTITPMDTMLYATRVDDTTCVITGLPAGAPCLFAVNEKDDYGFSYFKSTHTDLVNSDGEVYAYATAEDITENAFLSMELYTITEHDDGSVDVDMELYEVTMVDGDIPVVEEPVVEEAVVEEVVAEPVVPTAAPTASSILVDGEPAAFDAYNIDDNNYFKLRDVAYILNGTDAQFEVTWDNDLELINIISGEAYTEVSGEMAIGDGTAKAYEASTAGILLNGEAVELTAYTIANNNYFKLRDLGEALGFNVSWDNDAETIVVASNEAYTAD